MSRSPALIFASPRLLSWHRLMTEATTDSSVLVVGDSTGDGPTRWPRLLADAIAGQWPAWTVIWAPWNDATKSYPAANRVTVHTGTNGHTLTLWNGSVSGQVIGYARDNMPALTNGIGAPDVLLFNYGHNSPQTADGYRYLHAEAVMRYCNAYPKAAAVAIAQNPRDPAATEYATDQTRQRAIFEYSVDNGMPVVDVNADFRAYGNYTADLLNTDGLHPNDAAGSPRWAKLVWSTLKPTSAPLLAPGHQPTPNRLWLPAERFRALDGAPTLSTAYGVAAWSLPNGADTSVACTTDIPTPWQAQNIHLLTTASVAGVAGNQVIAAGSHMYVGTSTGAGGSINLGTYVQDATVTLNGAYTAGRTQDTTLWDRITLGASPTALRVMRQGTNASDTFANPVLMLGLVIERAY